MNSIDEAIAAAKVAAGNLSVEANTAMGGALAPAGGGIGLPAQKGAPLGLDDMLTGALNVVSWLKVNEFGITIGTDNTLHDDLSVAIPMREIAYCYSVRYGNPAVYDKTYDHVTAQKGGSWMQALARAQQVDPNAREFRSADIPFYALEDIKNKKGEVLVEAGKAVGHSLSVTAWNPFLQFTQKLKTEGIDAANGIVKIKLSFTVQKNAKGTWGVLDFKNPEALSAMPWDLN